MGKITTASDSFSRPADTTAYTAADLVANSTTAGSVVPLSFNVGAGSFKIVEAHISKSAASATNADFDIHLYKASPTPANGDNGAWSTDEAANWLGMVNMGAMTAFTDGAASRNALGLASAITDNVAASGVIYGLLVSNGAYTPASAETFTVTLHIER